MKSKRRISFSAYLFVLVAGLIVLPTSCSEDSGSATEPVTTMTLDTNTQNAINYMIDTMITNRGIPGAIVMVQKKGYKPWYTAVGVRDVATNDPMEVDNRFLVGSISKTFVGAVILQLVKEGKLGLDDKLVDHLDTIKLNGNYSADKKLSDITIRQLLNHTSGMGNYLNGYFVPMAFLNRATEFPRNALVDSLNNDSLLFVPGTGVQYSNSGFITLSLLAEKITGEKIEDLVQEKYLGPMGLTNTHFPANMSETKEWLDDDAHGYAIWTDGVRHDVTDFDPSYTWGAGAVVSNAEDLLTHLKEMLTGEKMLTPAIQAERLKFEETEMHGYGTAGFGLAIAEIGNNYRGHSGGWIGYNTNIYYVKDQEAYIITHVNRYSGGENPAWDLYLYVHDIVFPASSGAKVSAGEYIYPVYPYFGMDYTIDPKLVK